MLDKHLLGEWVSCIIFSYFGERNVLIQDAVYLQMVSTSRPENPKALSPSTQMTRCPGFLSLATTAAAMANPKPTPIVPKVPASSLLENKANETLQGGSQMARLA